MINHLNHKKSTGVEGGRKELGGVLCVWQSNNLDFIPTINGSDARIAPSPNSATKYHTLHSMCYKIRKNPSPISKSGELYSIFFSSILRE